MSKIKSDVLDQCGKVQSHNGIGGERVKISFVTNTNILNETVDDNCARSYYTQMF